jgi:pyruvate dehydrogenase E2 component (dihydrolipoyllysine-residue acetyltransferase)
MARLAIRMPKMSMTMTEGEVAQWQVSVGDQVEVGDVVCEVMTDKVDMEVESTVAGTLVEIVHDSGLVEVGEPIGWVEGEDDGGGFGDLLGAPEPEPEPTSVAEEPAAPTASPAEPTPAADTRQGPVPAVPRARGLAREQGIDLNRVAPSGPDGLVTVPDVEAAARAAAPAPPVAAPAPAPVAAPAAAPSSPRPAAPASGSADRRAAVRGIVARTMEPSALIPQFTVWRELHLDAADAGRQGVSWTTVLLQAYAAALRGVPELLSRWEDGRPVDSGPPAIALAVATDRGLLVPVFAEPDRTPPADLDAEIREVVAAAQQGKVGPRYLGIANGSLSNLGGLGVDRFQALLTPPQASVLSLGAIARRPVAVPGGLGTALTVHGGLTVDHRVADGAHAARLLADVAAALDPEA